MRRVVLTVLALGALAVPGGEDEMVRYRARTGARPRRRGARCADPARWRKTEADGIWSCDLGRTDVGLVVFMWDAGRGLCEQRPDRRQDAHIKSWSHSNRAAGYVIRNNVFAGAYTQLIEVCADLLNPDGSPSTPRLEDNVFIAVGAARLGVVEQVPSRTASRPTCRSTRSPRPTSIASASATTSSPDSGERVAFDVGRPVPFR